MMIIVNAELLKSGHGLAVLAKEASLAGITKTAITITSSSVLDTEQEAQLTKQAQKIASEAGITLQTFDFAVTPQPQ